MIRKTFRPFRTLALTLALTTLPVAAQVLTGELDGVVRDPTGAIIPGATVVITNSDQNTQLRTVKTDHAGEFTAPLLKVGTYSITVSAPGFRSITVDSIDVHVGQPSAIPVALAVGGDNQQVEVSSVSAEALPQLDSAAAGTLIGQRQVQELPLSDRNYLQLLSIQPGVVSGIPGRNTRGNITPSGAVNTQNFAVNGNTANSNGFYLDGVDTIKRAGQAPVTFPGIDFIQEINLQRALYGAEFGGPGSSVTSVQTKSGTTTFHGGAFEFLRSTVLDANSYFNKLAGLPRGGERYNDYGYFVGGPVFIPGLTRASTSKTFFFFGQEFLRSETAVQQNISNVPTLAQRGGVFATPVCLTATLVAGKCPTASQTTNIPVASFDPTAQAYLTDVIDKTPLPNSPIDPQGLIYNSPGINNETQTIIRIDRQVGSKLSLFFRYLDDPFNLVVPDGFQVTSQIPGVATSRITNGSTNWLGHATYVLGSNHVFEGGYSTRANWVTANSIGLLANANALNVTANLAGKLPYPNPLDHVPQLHIGASTYNVSGPYNERSPTQQIFLNNTNTLGRHTLILGFNIELEKSGSDQGAAAAGNYTFTAVGTPAAVGTVGTPGYVPATNVFVQAFAQFLQGRVSQFTQANKNVTSSSNLNLYEGYVQDNFHISPRLTVLGGVRYSYFAAASNQAFEDGSFLPVQNFLPSAFSKTAAPALTTGGLVCTVMPCSGGAAPNATTYNPINGIISGGINSPYGTAVAHGSLDNIEPRFGFTYDVFGDGTTSLRGGYGIYYFSGIGNPSKFATNQDPPNVSTITLSNTSFGNPAGTGTAAAAQPQAIVGYQASVHNPYTESFSLDLQQQLHPGTVLDIGYYGNHGVHLNSDVDLNQPLAGAYVGNPNSSISPVGTGTLAAGGNGTAIGAVTAGNTVALNPLRPYAGYAAIDYYLSTFKSHYNSLQTSLRTRLRNGTILTANYTWSKSLTNARTPQDNNNLAAEYGPLGNDRRHVFNAAFVYPTPFYKNQHGFLGRVAGGYEFSGIVTYGSGSFATPTIGAVDPGGLGLLTGPATARPDQVLNPNSAAPHSFAKWFNTAAFAPTPTPLNAAGARAGNARVQTIENPGYGVWNFNLAKNIRMYEKQNLQFRAEAYNVFNHTNFQNVSTTVGSTNYGQVTSTGDPRTMQVGVKYTF